MTYQVAKKLDLQSELSDVVADLTWDVKGIIHNDGSITPVPAESRVVTEIFQAMVIRRLISWGSKNGVVVEDNALFGRGYPDVTLCLGKDMIALDIKSARSINNDEISRMTLGTFDGYFLHPDKKLLHNKAKCYNDYAQHWVISIIYEWMPEKETEGMVNIVARCVGQKWQFAGRVAGSGDTANMGGINSLVRLQNLQSEFNDENEFNTYWRAYAIKHPRKRTKLP